MMMHRGDSDTRGIKLQVSSEKLFDRGKDWNSVVGLRLGGTRLVGLYSRNQCNSKACRFQLAIDAKMVAAKCARSRNGNP
jgi:hypothetical protein